MSKLIIYVCVHKKDERTRSYAPYVPIHGGKKLHPEMELGFIGDDTGDNISDKNPMYSEWSVIYWIWKNCHDVEYVGLNHYRRYFNKDITQDNIKAIMGKADLIAVKRTNKSKRSRLDDLGMMTSLEDAYLFADSVLSIHPECKNALLEYLYNSTESFPFSMFIMKRELFEDYCKFVFPILFDLEKRIKKHGYSRQSRAIGYFGEFSLGLFIYYRKLKVKGIEITGTDELGNKIHRIINRIYKFYYRLPEFFLSMPKDIIVPDVIKTGLKNDGILLQKLK